jgi:hypothetical protein
MLRNLISKRSLAPLVLGVAASMVVLSHNTVESSSLPSAGFKKFAALVAPTVAECAAEEAPKTPAPTKMYYRMMGSTGMMVLLCFAFCDPTLLLFFLFPNSLTVSLNLSKGVRAVLRLLGDLR